MSLALAFVDSISDSAALRLDLTAAPWKASSRDTNFGTPTLGRSVASTLLVDGDYIGAAAMGNRVITLALDLSTAASDDAAAVLVQDLQQELARPNNYLRYRPENATNAVYFRTWRSDVGAVRWNRRFRQVTAQVVADPWAYGVKETIGATLNANSTFEAASISPWTGQNGTVVYSTAHPHAGSGGLQFTPTGGLSPAGPRSETVPATAGLVYTATVWVYSVAGWASGVSAAIDWLDSTGSLISTTTGTITALAAATQTKYTTTAQAPAGTTQAQFRARMAGTPAASDVMWMDDVTFAQSLLVTFDPAVTNGCYFDVANIKGDVETPAVLKIAGTLTATQSMIAVRRRGTAANLPLVMQAESMTLSTGSFLPGNNASFSGAGSNYVQHGFAAGGVWENIGYRNPWPATPSADNRGTYRVLVRYLKSSSPDVIQLRVTRGGNTVASNDAVTLPAGGASTPPIADLGLVTFPVGPDPTTDATGAEMSVLGQYVGIDAMRVSGSGNINIDYVLFVPADDRLAIAGWPAFSVPAGSSLGSYVVDGITDQVYVLSSLGEILPADPGSAVLIGGSPMLSPTVPSRVVFVQEVAPTVAAALGLTAPITIEYVPRYLHVKPIST